MVKQKNIKGIIFNTPLLRTLDFLLQNPEKEFSDIEISRENIGAKRSAINNELNNLSQMGLISRVSRGRAYSNRLEQTNPVNFQLKIVSNLLTIAAIVDKCKPSAFKIVLFGSRATGLHMSESDFDFLIVSNEHDKIRKIFSAANFPFQLILKDPVAMMGLHNSEPQLAAAISKGIVLWEKE